MRKAFITGGAGFLGRHLLRALHDAGVETIALARSSAAAERATAAGADHIVRGDLFADEAIRAGMAGCDVVFHLAASTQDGAARAKVFRVNSIGTQRMVTAAQNARASHFVYVSSESVLIDGVHDVVDADETWPVPQAPLGPYASSKAEAERTVRAANSDTFHTVIVRPSWMWGEDDTTILPNLIASIRKGQFAWIGGDFVRSFSHVDNVVEGLLAARERGQPGATYFITDGPPRDARTFITQLLATRGVTMPQKSMTKRAALRLAAVMEAAFKVLPGAAPMTRGLVHLIGSPFVVSDRLARDTIGYVGRVSVEDGFAQMRATSPRIAIA